MSGFKPKTEQPVTVTVRRDGSYYVEKVRVQARPRQLPVVQQIHEPPGTVGQYPASPVAAAITTTLKDLAGIAFAARAAAPTLGKYGVIAAIGLGVLNAWAASKPSQRPAPVLRRIRLRRIPR